MKKIYKQIIFVIVVALGAWSCEDYLDVPPDANISEEDIFSNYNSFQGFVDQCYEFIVDYNSHAICVSGNLGGEVMGSKGWISGYHGSYGLYWALANDGGQRSIFNGYNSGNGIHQNGIWDFCWDGARVCNIGLGNLELLTNATQDEKDIIKGQLHFFRAFLHWEVVRAYGAIPYVDTLLTADNIAMPRFWEYSKNGKTYKNTQAVYERIVDDLDLAVGLLPEIWDAPEALAGTNQPNLGRITKGAALALKAKALLFAGSPLFNEESGGSASFDTDYMNRAAQAAGEVIKLAEKGVYSLEEMIPDEDIDPYRQMFATVDGTYPYSAKETLLGRIRNRGKGRGRFNSSLSRLYSTGNGGVNFGGNAPIETPTQNFLDKWEMADGTRYKPGKASEGGYDDDADKRWENRDPRFRKTFWIHGDDFGKFKLNCQVGGKDNSAVVLNPYFIHKYWPKGIDNKNKNWRQFDFSTPMIRLAEVYLIYAEAVFEGTGDPSASVSGVGMSAVDAVNKVRERAGMLPTTANPVAYQTTLEGHGETSSDHPFRLQVRNERNVELCFEGHYWWDTRRWKVAHTLDKNLYRLDFDKNVTYTSREVVQEYLFETRHYWLPFKTDVTLMYEGWPQNPGW